MNPELEALIVGVAAFVAAFGLAAVLDKALGLLEPEYFADEHTTSWRDR